MSYLGLTFCSKCGAKDSWRGFRLLAKPCLPPGTYGKTSLAAFRQGRSLTSHSWQPKKIDRPRLSKTAKSFQGVRFTRKRFLAKVALSIPSALPDVVTVAHHSTSPDVDTVPAVPVTLPLCAHPPGTPRDPVNFFQNFNGVPGGGFPGCNSIDNTADMLELAQVGEPVVWPQCHPSLKRPSASTSSAPTSAPPPLLSRHKQEQRQYRHAGRP